MAAAGIDTDKYSNITNEDAVHIMKNSKNGYYTLTESHTEYTFPVKAGKTYYLFVNGSRMGFNSFNFVADNTPSSTLEIDGADNETAKTDLTPRENCTVTLNRKLIADQPNTLMLPFSMTTHMVENTFGEGTVVLHVKEIDDQKITFVRHHYPMVIAGEPCIIYPKKSGESWTITNVTIEDEEYLNYYQPVSGSGFTFTGCFQKETMNTGSYWVSTKKGGQSTQGQDVYLYQTTKPDFMSNTRAFFQNTAGNSSAKLTTALFEDALDENSGSAPTGISIVQAESETSARQGVYTLKGQKLASGEHLSKGIYIINGKKVVVE